MKIDNSGQSTHLVNNNRKNVLSNFYRCIAKENSNKKLSSKSSYMEKMKEMNEMKKSKTTMALKEFFDKSISNYKDSVNFYQHNYLMKRSRKNKDFNYTFLGDNNSYKNILLNNSIKEKSDLLENDDYLNHKIQMRPLTPIYYSKGILNKDSYYKKEKRRRFESQNKLFNIYNELNRIEVLSFQNQFKKKKFKNILFSKKEAMNKILINKSLTNSLNNSSNNCFLEINKFNNNDVNLNLGFAPKKILNKHIHKESPSNYRILQINKNKVSLNNEKSKQINENDNNNKGNSNKSKINKKILFYGTKNDFKNEELKLFSFRYERDKENFSRILFAEKIDQRKKKFPLENFIKKFSNKNFIDNLYEAKKCQ